MQMVFHLLEIAIVHIDKRKEYIYIYIQGVRKVRKRLNISKTKHFRKKFLKQKL